MRRSLSAFVTVVASLLVCSLVAPAVGGGVVAAQNDAGEGGFAALAQDFEADRVDFEITVYENGSATWAFRYKQDLETEQDRQDFETYAEEFNENETDLYRTFRRGAMRLTTNGTEVTGRNMSAENFQREARTEGLDPAQATRGVIEMSFRWDGFARVEQPDDGRRVVMGDVFEGGLYITSEQQLIVRAGPELAFSDVQPDDGEFDEGTMAESDTVTWSGGTDGREFNPSRPRVVFGEADAVSTTPAESDPGWLFPAGAFLVVLLLGIGAVVAYRSGVFGSTEGGGEATADPGGESGGSVADDASAGDASANATPAVTDEELISDEERVVNLLEDNGGRMKQVKIVDETGWSKSKVSMLLSDMEEEGTISKLRVGRENIVSLAGHEPDAAGSPFEDEK